MLLSFDEISQSSLFLRLAALRWVIPLLQPVCQRLHVGRPARRRPLPHFRPGDRPLLPHLLLFKIPFVPTPPTFTIILRRRTALDVRFFLFLQAALLESNFSFPWRTRIAHCQSVEGALLCQYAGNDFDAPGSFVNCLTMLLQAPQVIGLLHLRPSRSCFLKRLCKAASKYGARAGAKFSMQDLNEGTTQGYDLMSFQPKWRRTRCNVSANLRRGVEQMPGDPLNFRRCDNSQG